MSSTGFLTNPAFRDYVRALRELHVMIRDNRDESDDGERLREQMDALAQNLSEQESVLLHELSADFYDASDRDYHPTRRMTREAERALSDVIHPKAKVDPLSRLAVLRKYHAYLEPAALAYARARIWYEAEEFRVASDYFKQAAELLPSNPSFPVLWLDSLARGDRSEAVLQARTLLRDRQSRTSSRLIFQAAEVLFTEATRSDDDQSRQTYQELEPIFRELSQDSQLLVDMPSILTGAHALLGFCRERLGNVDGAIEAFGDALQIDPNHDAMLTAKAILLYPEQLELAVRDFQAAIRCGTDLAAPYHFLGHYHLSQGDYRSAIRMADEAASRSKSDRVRAECHEWKAICLAGMGATREAVLEEFEVAESLDPAQPRIRENKTRYANGSVTPNWKLPSAKEFQSVTWADIQRISVERAHAQSTPADRTLAV